MPESKDSDYLRRTATLTLGQGAQVPGQRPETVLPRGASVGRYLVLDRVGGGGMGVVYSAFDPELDRKVAVKLLRVELFESAEGYEARLRLLREAQALARLAHPNVVAVHDVGTFQGQVFVAMEFVEGQTLSQWVKEQNRPWREVLKVYRQAGEGLAAAHEAGLVHRDFKPSNVALGQDRRVRVLDFGLAAPLESMPEQGGAGFSAPLAGDSVGEAAPVAPEAEQPTETHQSSVLGAHLTRTGSTLGTPAYMAPEQHLGLGVDARSDQFAFCVALYEALYGELPFRSSDLKTLVSQVRQGTIPEPVAPGGIPPWLRRVVLRGLARDPEQRYPSMRELLEALSKDPSVTRRRWLRGAAAVLLAGAVGLGVYNAQRRQLQLCQGAERKLEGIWDESRRQGQRQAFLSTDVKHAAETADLTETVLDRYVWKWAEQHVEACEATRLRGEQSEELLDLRMGCLDERLRELRALTDLFSEADDNTVARAVDASYRLRSVEPCSNLTMLQAVVPPPEDEETRREVGEARDQLADIKAMRDTGKSREALELAEEATRVYEHVDHAPLRARLRFELGVGRAEQKQLASAQEALFLAALDADRGKNDTLRANILIEKAWARGDSKEEFALSQRDLAEAEATLQRVASDPELDVRWHYVAAEIANRAGHFQEAVELATIAVERAALFHGRQHAMTARCLHTRTHAQARLGSYRAAQEAYAELVSLWESIVGPNHPDTGLAELNLGIAFGRLGETEEALRHLRRALEIVSDNQGPESGQAASILNSIGLNQVKLARYDQARESFRQAKAIHRVKHGDRSLQVSRVTANLGLSYWEQEQWSAARERLEDALAMKVEVWGTEHPGLVSPLSDLAQLLNDQGLYQEGLDRADQALVQAEGAYTPQSTRWKNAQTRRAESLLGLGRRNEALDILQGLEDQISLDQDPPYLYGDTRFLLARALWPTRPSRALNLARAAREGYEAMGPQGGRYLQRLDAWLAGKAGSVQSQGEKERS